MSRAAGSDRATVLADLVNLRVAVADAVEAVRKLPWDSAIALTGLDRRAVTSVLTRFRTGGLTAQELESWADAIEARDDIGFEPGHEKTLAQFVFETANPFLAKALTDQYAVSWIERMTSSP